MKKESILMLAIGLACLVWSPRGATASELHIKTQPNQILMGASYNGQMIEVSGTVPADETVVIRVTGHAEHNKLKKKGRAMGILWMNQGTVEISNVPNVFMLYLSQGNSTTASTGSLTGSRLGLDLEAVHKQAEISSQYGDQDALFQEFVKLKQKAGLYGTFPDAIHYTKESDHVKSFQCSLSMPSALPPGMYKLEAFSIKNDTIAAHSEQELEAREVGMTAFISTLAFQHGTLYGVLAVLVAVIAGLLTGIMFKGGKGAH